MNYLSLGLAAFGGLVASFAFGSLTFWLAPGLIKESHKYPNVFRAKEEMFKLMPVGIIANCVSILITSIIFAMIYPSGSGLVEGASFGMLMAVFVVCAFVFHNYVNLNIGLKLALGQAAAYFVQWVVIGAVIGLIYRPLITP